ncbi:hypothetical protein DXG01_006520 [Tephrocybe rancida]|nr:hypothetical protein DXG01_006520 [Tephrocybe rancida]
MREPGLLTPDVNMRILAAINSGSITLPAMPANTPAKTTSKRKALSSRVESVTDTTPSAPLSSPKKSHLEIAKESPPTTPSRATERVVKKTKKALAAEDTPKRPSTITRVYPAPHVNPISLSSDDDSLPVVEDLMSPSKLPPAMPLPRKKGTAALAAHLFDEEASEVDGGRSCDDDQSFESLGGFIVRDKDGDPAVDHQIKKTKSSDIDPAEHSDTSLAARVAKKELSTSAKDASEATKVTAKSKVGKFKPSEGTVEENTVVQGKHKALERK